MELLQTFSPSSPKKKTEPRTTLNQETKTSNPILGLNRVFLFNVASLRRATLHKKTRTTAKSAQSVSVFAPPISLAPLFCVSLFLTFLIEGQKRGGPKQGKLSYGSKERENKGPKKSQNFTIGKPHPGMCFFGVQNDVLFGIQKMFLTFSEVRSGKGGWVGFNGQRPQKGATRTTIQATEKTKRQNKMTKTRTNSSNLNKQQHKQHQTAAKHMKKQRK